MKINVAYSFLAGFFACLVSLLIKLTFNIDNYTVIENQNLKFVIQIVLVIISFLCNSFMWLFFSKSLEKSFTSLYSTSLNKLSNFIFSALLGFFILNENINITRWSFGITILSIGILILGQQSDIKNEKNQISKNN